MRYDVDIDKKSSEDYERDDWFILISIERVVGKLIS